MKKKAFLVVIAGLFAVSGVNAAETRDSEKEQGSKSFLEELLTMPLAPVQGVGNFLEGKVFNLGEIKVSGSRVESDLSNEVATNIPHNITVIGPEEIRDNPSQNLSDILITKEGVNVSDDIGGGLNARVDLRGFGGEAKQALVIFDGVRAVEPFDNSTTWHLYPSEFLRQVEIQRGGGSTIYGEGALSGVINLKTKEPTKEFKLSTENSLGSFAAVKDFVETSGTVSGIGFYWGNRYYNTDGYRQNADEESASSLFKLKYDWTDLAGLENAFYYAKDKTGIPGPLSAAEVEQNRRQKDPDGQFGDRFYDKLVQDGLTAHLYLEKLNIMLTNLLGYRYRVQNSVQSFGGDFPGKSTNGIVTETYSDVIQASWDAEGDFYKSNLTSGFEWEIDDIHNPFTFDDFTFGPFSSDRKIDRRLLGVFVQHRATLWERLIVESGLRWDKIDWNIQDLLSPELQKRKRTDHYSPSLGVEYKLWEPLSLYASYAQSFKVPDSNTLIFETPNIFKPNPNIDPSVANHYEIGTRYAHPLFGSVRLDYFYIETKKEILFDDITNLNENFDTKRQGVELGNEIAVTKWLELILNYTYTKARFDNGLYDRKTIPLVPQNKWTAGFLVKPDEHWSFYGNATGVYDQFALNDFNNQFAMENYWTANAKAAYMWKNWQAYVRVDNIFDEKYSSFVTSDGVSTVNFNPSPGRTFEAGFKVEI